MGLSKKLGGGGGAAGGGVGGGAGGGVGGGGGGWAGPDVSYTWSTQAYSLREILTRFRLPCVVQCQGQGESTTVYWEPSHFRFELRQPLLLHAARSVRKVHARSLRARGDPAIQLQQQQQPGQHPQQPQQSPASPRSVGDLLEEFGPPLAIPEDYDGWFYPLGRHNSHTATVHTLPRHNKVEGAAAAGPRQFLVTTPLPAFKAVAGSGGNKYVPHEVGVGEVLTKVGIMKGEPSLSAGSGIASVSSALIPRSKQSLRCLDENRQEVIIPFSQRSLLYDVAENYSSANAQRPAGGESEKCGISLPGVVHTRTIVEVGNSSLPRIFKHVLGEPPALAEAFTGVLRCYSVFTEETVLAAAMCRASFSPTALVALTATSSASAAFSSCLELATSSSCKFNIALNGTELKKTVQYALALKTCEEQAPTFVRAIKVAFTVNPVSPAVNGVEQTLSGAGAGDVDVGEQLVSAALKLQAEQEAAQTKSITFSGPNKDSNQGKGGQTESDSTDTDEILTDSASVSDAAEGAEMFDGSSVSDTAEVDANSEFDISWGQLKRAQSFEGSLSSIETDPGTLSSCSISECSDCDSVLAGSVIAATRREVSYQSDASVKKESLLHNNEERMDQRASAPSPVYVNIQKKGLSIFNASSEKEKLQNTLTEAENVNSLTMDCNSVDGQKDFNSLRETDETSITDKHSNQLETLSDRSCSPNSSISSVITSSLDKISSVLLRAGDSDRLCQQFEEPGPHSDLTSENSSARSVLSISPTLSEIQHCNTESKSFGHVAECMKKGDGKAIGNNAQVYQDARGQNSKTNQQTLKAEGEIATQGHPLSQNIGMQPTKFADRSNLLQSERFRAQHSPLPSHTQISPHSSILSLSSCSSMSTLNSHTDLSSRSSVQSEGTTQDLAIQRLERAMNEASNFLKSSVPPSAESVEEMEFLKENSPPVKSLSVSSGCIPSQTQQDTQSVFRISPVQKSDPRVFQQGSLSSPKYSKTGQIFGQLSSQSKLPHSHEGLKTSDTRLSGGGVSPTSYPPVAVSRPSSAFQTSILSAGTDSTILDGKLSAAQPKASLLFVAAKPHLGSIKQSVYPLSTHQSDSMLCSSSEKLTGVKEAKLCHGNSGHNADKSASGHEESQNDHDFVKTLGDRLSSVSRLSSLPRYQRLQADSDTGDDSSCDSQYEVTPRLLSGASSDSSLAGETGPVVAMIDWDDRQDEVVV